MIWHLRLFGLVWNCILLCPILLVTLFKLHWAVFWDCVYFQLILICCFFLSLSSQLGAFLYFFVYMVCVPFFCRCFINTTIHCLFKKIQSIWWGHRYEFTVPFKVKISLHLITHLSLLVVHMLSFIVPISVCNRLEKLLSDFIWAYSEEGKNFHLVKYSFMVLPGDFGLGDPKSAGY